MVKACAYQHTGYLQGIIFLLAILLLRKEQQMVTKGTDSAYQHTVDRITPAHKEQAKGEVTACCASREDF